MSQLPRLHGEIESRRPLRATAGLVTLTGWCLIAGQPFPPAMRLVTAAGIVPLSQRHTRTDVSELHPAEPAARVCGFHLEGPLREGVYLARLQAQALDGNWRNFKTLSLTVEPPTLAAAIDTPAHTAIVHERVEVEGWALHPRHRLQALTLRYGHQEIPCDLGRRRPDLARSRADAPHAIQAGFKSRTILSAGRGPLRLKAQLADGSLAVARTSLAVSIDEDENHPASLDLGTQRVPLPASPLRPILPPPIVDKPQHVLFILPGSFASNSALHVAGLANQLGAAGYTCAVAVAHDPATLTHHFQPAFSGLTYATAEAGPIFSDGQPPDIIHAWTTRENVRRLTLRLRDRHAARVIVHLEDNEQLLLAHALGRPFAEIAAWDDATLASVLPPDLSHPRRSQDFLAQADGVTFINERLTEFVDGAQPCHLITPAADPRCFFSRPIPLDFRRQLGFPVATTFLFYHGNVHAANAAEINELYSAVLQLNRAGQSTVLLRTGRDSVNFLGPIATEVAPHVLSLGQITHQHHLPALMALADIFVQPGVPDAFNDYRFPSKLPEFFTIGRPVILPRTNLGLQLRHGEDAYILDRADAAAIAAAITRLRGDPALTARLGRGAIACAESHFSWPRSAAALAKFYRTLAPSQAA